MRTDHALIVKDSNAFGSWKIHRWAPMPPEANHVAFVLRWKSTTNHTFGYSIHPTEAEARAAVPFTNEGMKQCPMDTTTPPRTARCAIDPSR